MTNTPSIETVLKAWLQYRQHTLGSNLRTVDAEDEFWSFINNLIDESLAHGWDYAADEIESHATVDSGELLAIAEELRENNPYREQEGTND